MPDMKRVARKVVHTVSTGMTCLRTSLWIRLALATLLAALCIHPHGRAVLDGAAEAMGPATLRTQNDAYLQRSTERALHTFLVLSTVKAGLAVIEGSETGVTLGVNVGIELGDIVQSVYDHVDIAWKTVLAGTVVLWGTRHVLATAQLVDSWFLAVAFAVAAVALALGPSPWWRNRLRRSGRALVAALFGACLLLYVFLPLSIRAGAAFSEKITSPSLRRAERGFRQLEQEVSPPPETAEGVVARVRVLRTHANHVVDVVVDRSTDLADWVVRLIAGTLFDTVIFPLGTFLLLFCATRAAVRLMIARTAA